MLKKEKYNFVFFIKNKLKPYVYYRLEKIFVNNNTFLFKLLLPSTQYVISLRI